MRRRSFGLFTLFAALPLRVNAAAEISRETAISALTAAAYELFPHDNVDESLYGTLAETFFSTDEDRALRLGPARLGADRAPPRSDSLSRPSPRETRSARERNAASAARGLA